MTPKVVAKISLECLAKPLSLDGQDYFLRVRRMAELVRTCRLFVDSAERSKRTIQAASMASVILPAYPVTPGFRSRSEYQQGKPACSAIRHSATTGDVSCDAKELKIAGRFRA